MAAEPIEAKLRAATKAGRLDARLQPGEGVEALGARAVAAGVIGDEEAAMLVAARDATAIVVRVDDFPIDLGVAEARRSLAAVPPSAIVRKAAA